MWVTEGGNLGTADWGCLAAALACVCRLHAAAGRSAALVSDESALEACIRDDALYKLTVFTFLPLHLCTHLNYPIYAPFDRYNDTLC